MRPLAGNSGTCEDESFLTEGQEIMTAAASENVRNHAAFIWSVADLLRGDYKQSEYGRVILPMVVLRRLDCVLEPTKEKVLKRLEQLTGRLTNVEKVLCQAAGQQFYNVSPLSMTRLLDDPNHIADNLRSYVLAFSPGATDVLQKFDLLTQIDRLDRADLLYLVVSRFCDIDLHPDNVSNLEMGYLYEELVRRFSELSNETAGEHFTPREVIRLMVNLLFIEDDQLLTKPGVVKSMLDPACGTGGMLSVAEDHLRSLHPQARLEVFGQELNPETYAICRSDMMLKGQDASHIVLGNSFSEDGFVGERFDYLLANPPFGVEWKKVERAVRDEHDSKGFAGRFGAGLPRINDGSFLFLQHMIAHMKPVEHGGSRLAIVFNGSPLFTGSAGSGEMGDPPLDHRERLAGSRRRTARPAVLQHRDFHLLLCRDQSQERAAARQGATCRCTRSVAEDAQKPRQQTQRVRRRAHCQDHQAVRGV